jgi:O-antigen/teichoic acid export membrane protein
VTAGDLVKGSALLSASRGGSLLLQAAHFALVARTLPVDEFAGFAAALALLAIVASLAEFGVTSTTILALAGRTADPRRELGASLAANGMLVALALAAIPVVAVVLPPASQQALLCLLPWFVLMAMQSPFLALRRYRLEFRRLAAADVVGRAVPLLAVLPLVTASSFPVDTKLLLVAAGMFAGAGASFALLVSRGLSSPEHGWFQAGRRSIGSAAPLGLTSALSMIHTRVDQIVLAAYGVTAGLAHYAVAYRALDAALALTGAAGVAGFSLLVRSQGSDRREVVRTQACILAIASVVVGVAAFSLAPQLMVLLGGDGFRDGTDLVRLLAPALVVAMLNVTAAQVVISAGQVRALVRIAIAAVAANIALNVLFVPSFGAKAAAATTVVSELLGFVLVSRSAGRVLPGSIPGHIAVVALGSFAAASYGGWAFSHVAGSAAGALVGISVVVAGSAMLWRARAANNAVIPASGVDKSPANEIVGGRGAA